MKNSFWNKKIPTIVGMLFLMIGIGATSIFVQKGTTIFSRASSDDQPVDVRVSNISDTSASISFTTTSNSIAQITYGKEQEKPIAISDTRDQQTSPTAYKTHFFTLHNLVPATIYEFTIISNGTEYQNINQPFQFTTGGTLSNNSSPTQKITGKLITQDAQPAKGALIYLTSDNTQQLSTITGLDGGFSFELNSVRTKDVTQFSLLPDMKNFTILAQDGQQETHVSFLLNQANPLPTLTLGQDYDFSIGTTPLSQTPEASTAARVTFPIFDSTPENADVQITSPRKLQHITEAQPVFQGKAKPNETVSITIHSETIQAKVLTNRQGLWSYRPTVPLSTGTHTITIRAKDTKDVVQTISQSFTVELKAPLSQATGTTQLVTPTTKPPAIPTQTPTPTTLPTPIPATSAKKISRVLSDTTTTIVSTPTPLPVTATSIPATPTTAVLMQPSATPKIAGNSFILSIGFLAGLVGIIGTALFFFGALSL